MVKTPRQLLDELCDLTAPPDYRENGGETTIQREHYKAYRWLHDNQHRLCDALQCLSMTLENTPPLTQPRKDRQ